MNTLLTGIKPSGEPHLGNYISVIKPLEELSQNNNIFAFIADGHAITNYQKPKDLKNNIESVAATWLSCNIQNMYLYRQSKVPQIFELFWILSCFTAKGFMNRSHGYLTKVEQNKEKDEDPDKEIFMGLFNYPILMAADILLFNISQVPIGKDQKQHLENTRDIAKKINHVYKKNLFTLPEPFYISEEILPGIDGRKMSKSYNNIISLFCSEKKLKKKIFSIVTNSKDKGERKYPEESDIIKLFNMFTNYNQKDIMNNILYKGDSWKNIKEYVFETINNELINKRERYKYFMNNKTGMYSILERNEEEIRKIANNRLQYIKEVIGFTL